MKTAGDVISKYVNAKFNSLVEAVTFFALQLQFEIPLADINELVGFRLAFGDVVVGNFERPPTVAELQTQTLIH